MFFEDRWTVSEKIELVMKAITERTSLKFSELFAAAMSRTEVVVTFLALLELIRMKQLAAVQAEPFGEIEICRSTVTAAETTTEAPPPNAEAAASP